MIKIGFVYDNAKSDDEFGSKKFIQSRIAYNFSWNSSSRLLNCLSLEKGKNKSQNYSMAAETFLIKTSGDIL